MGSWKAPIHNVTKLSSGQWFLASWCAAKLLVEPIQLLLGEFEELLQQLQLLGGQLARVPAAQRAKWWIILNLYLSLEIAAKLFPILALRTYKLSSNKCFYFQLPQPFRYYLVLLSKSSEVNSSFNKSKLVSLDIGEYVMNKRHELSENHWYDCVWMDSGLDRGWLHLCCRCSHLVITVPSWHYTRPLGHIAKHEGRVPQFWNW